MSPERAAPPEPSPPVRVVVTHPRTTAARRGGGYVVGREIQDLTPIGTVFVRSLVRSQLRVSSAVLAGLALLIGGLPLLGALVPSVLSARVVGVPIAWVVLGVLAFPLLVATGAWYVRSAERAERQFVDLVHRR